MKSEREIEEDQVNGVVFLHAKCEVDQSSQDVPDV